MVKGIKFLLFLQQQIQFKMQYVKLNRCLWAALMVSTLFACTPKNQEIIQLPNGTTDVVSYQTEGDSLKIGKFSNGSVYFKSQKRSGLKGFTETETFTYHHNGQLRKYAFLVNDSLRYFRFYTRDGKLENTGGCALVYLDNESLYVDTVQVNEPYFHQLRFALPPNCQFRLLYGDEVEDEGARDLAKNPLQLLPQKETMTGFLVKEEQPAVLNKVLYWSLEDTVCHHIEKGVVWRKFVVTE